jgi:DNA-binding winged helix-turn-helix (wHTH) protein/TolB-like protein/Flp pilus assembly protein TadD
VIYRFDGFELDSERFLLRHQGEPVHLEPKVMEFLIFLLENRQRLVTKQELLDALWEQDFVGEAVLTRCVYLARRALDDAPRQQRFVRTVHGRGYQFNDQITVEVVDVAHAVDAVAEASRTEVSEQIPSSHPRVGVRWRIAAVGALGVVLLGAAIFLWWWFGSSRMSEDEALPLTVAVWPFAAQGDSEASVIADIMTRELTVHLKRAKTVRIVSMPPSAIGDESELRDRILNERRVRYTVNGHVVLAEGEINASMTVLDQHDGSVIWTESLGGTVDEAYSIAARIATSAGHAVGLYLDAHGLAFPGREAFEHYMRSSMFLRSYDPRQIPQAIEEARECIRLAPDFEPAHSLLASGLMQYRNLGIDYDPARLLEAAEHLDRAIERLPFAGSMPWLQAWLAVHTYDVHGAREWLDTMPEIEPTEMNDYTLSPWISYSMGEVDRALRELDNAIFLRPFDSVIRLNTVVLATMLGRQAEAERAFNDFPRLHQSELVQTVTLGWVLIGRGELEEAAETFTQAAEQYGYRLLSLAAAEAELANGEPGSAILHLQKWLETNPWALEAHWMLCLAHSLLGQETEARQAAGDAASVAGRLRENFDSPALEVYELYFRVFADQGVAAADVRAVDPASLDSFARYLHAACLARLGEPDALARTPTPHNPVYWVSRFSKLELDLLGVEAEDAEPPPVEEE